MPAASSAFSSVQHLGLDRAQQARLNSWVGAIAVDLKKSPPTYIGSKGELRFGRKGSFAVYRDTGWMDWESGQGGPDAVSLILYLFDGSPSDARAYAIAWLAANPGTGDFSATPISDAEREAKDREYAAYADEVLHRAESVTPRTATFKYLSNARGLSVDQLPDCVVHLEVGRENESAVVGILTDSAGDVVGVQLGHLDITGAKSVYEPIRHHFLLDREKAKDGAFRIHATPIPDGLDVSEPVRALSDTVIIVEGLEDALSLHEAAPFSAVWGLPGIGRLRHLKVTKGTKIMVVADGDDPDSAAHATLVKGLDHLILEGADVRLATCPAGSDANDLLRSGGVAKMHEIVATAVPATLSPKGRLAQVCRMPWVDFQLAVRGLAKELHTNSPFLTNQWKKAHEGDQHGVADGNVIIPEEIPWPAPVNDIAAVCDAALAEVQRYIVADSDDLAVKIIWDLGAHFVHHEHIILSRFPRLEIGGEDVEVGKTSTLQMVGELVPRALPIGGSISPAAFYRAIDAHQVSVLIDEAHDLFKRQNDQSHLLAIMRSGHTRKMAFTLLTEPTPDGKHALRRFSTWAPIAYTVIGRLADAGMRSRAVSIRLIRALEGEVRADLDEDDLPVLKTARQQFVRWAGDQTELPMVPRPPGLFNRRWNNWAPLMRIAALVGGEWPGRIARAAQRALVAPAPTNSDGAVAALTDIRDIFDTSVRGNLRDRIASDQLCREMTELDEPSAEWKYIRRGQPITPLYLRERLRGLVNPAGSQRWKDHQGRALRGYLRVQFEEAFRRYLPPKAPEADGDIHAPPPPAAPVTPGRPVTDGNSGSDSSGVGGDGSGDGSTHLDPSPDPSPVNPLNERGKTGEVTGLPGVTGQSSPSPHGLYAGLRPPWEAPEDEDEAADVPAVPPVPVAVEPAKPVFPDGLALPFDLDPPVGPPAPPDDPKKEEYW